TRRKRLLDLAADRGTALERLDRPRLVEVQHRVELIGESRMEVMARALGLGTINDSDRAFEPRLAQSFGKRAVTAKIEHEARHVDLVKQRLVAAGKARPNALSLRGRVPIRRRGDRAMVRRKADQKRLPAVAFPDQLTDIELARLADLGRASIAQMRVVLPHRDLRLLPETTQMRGKR